MTISKIKTSGIEDSSVTADQLAENSVTSAKIGVDVIVAEDIANNAITVAELADNAVTNAKLADDAVDTTELADGAVTSAKLDTNIDIAGTLDVTGATTLDDGLVVDNDGATVATFDRATSDGDIVEFQKDGSTVGVINSAAGVYITMGSGDTGFSFNPAVDGLLPHNPTTNAQRDAADGCGDN